MDSCHGQNTVKIFLVFFGSAIQQSISNSHGTWQDLQEYFEAKALTNWGFLKMGVIHWLDG